MLKILHTGDLHLDSAFSSLDERQAKLRKNEMRAAFTSMMTYARMNGIDLLLMAGDVVDSRFVTKETAALLANELAKFEKPVFIAPGNHDYADQNSIWRRIQWPENVHIFLEDTLSCVDVPSLDIMVWGYGFTSPFMESCPAAGKTVADPNRINILVCHCDTLLSDDRKAPIKESQIAAFGADYAALGHYHNPPAAGEKWAYCGCLEPKNFGENGPKGVCVVEVDKQNGTSTVRMKRVRFSKRRFENEVLDITGASTMEDVRQRTAAFLSEKKFGEDILLRLKYTGMVETGLVLDADQLGDMGLFCLQVEDKTFPAASLDALASDTGIRGAFYRKLAPALESDDPDTKDTALKALRYGLAAIAGENLV